jgi:multidrug resistance efflux pump
MTIMAVDVKTWQSDATSKSGKQRGAPPPDPRGFWLFRAIRYGGRWFLRWPLRLLILAGIVAAGFLPYNHEIGGQCRVVAVREVALRAQLQDEIAEILVADGDQVMAGQVIATLSGREERAALAEAEADVEYAEANLKQVETGPREEDITKAANMVAMWQSQVEYWDGEHKRQKGLVASQAGAVNSMEKALSSFNSAKSMLISAQEEERKLRAGHRDETIAAAQSRVSKAIAHLRLQEQRMPLCEIKCSMTGTISTPGLQLRAGQTVSPGDLIAVVRDQSSLRLEVLADEAAADSVHTGQVVKARLWGLYGDLITGLVSQVGFATTDKAQFIIEPFRSDRETRQEQARFPGSDTRFLKVVVGFEKADPRLLPGMTGEARIVVGEDYFWNALWRPIKRFLLVEVWSWLP